MDYEVFKIEDGKPIIIEGSWVYYVFIILSGKAKVVRTQEGEEEFIGTLKEGDVVGEMSAIGVRERTASVIADGDVEVAAIRISELFKVMSKFSAETQSKLHVLSAILADITKICSTLKYLLHELEDMKTKLVDMDSFKKELVEEMKNMPEIYQKIFMTLVKRLEIGMETLTKLDLEVKNAAEATGVGAVTAKRS